jgi:hypothetical protein
MSDLFEVRIPYDDRGHMLICHNIPKDRPSYVNAVGGVMAALEDDLHYWLEERNIEYKI